MTRQLITLTPSAIGRIHDVVGAGKGKVLRLSTKTAGCSGIRYDLQMVDAAAPGDMAIDADGVPLYVDPMALVFIAGTEIDWVANGLSRSFEFRNPNETSRCGCGESFTTAPCS